MNLSRIFSVRVALIGVSILLVAALVYAVSFVLWADRNLVDSQTFATGTVNALSEESSREVLATAAVNRLVTTLPALEPFSAPLRNAIAQGLANEQVQETLLTVGTKLHAILFDGLSEGLVVDFSVVRDRVVVVIEGIAPRLVPLIPDDLFDSIEIVAPGSVPELGPLVDQVRTAMWIAFAALLVVAGLVIWRSPSTPVTLLMFGGALTLSGLVTAILVPGGRSMTIGAANDPNVEVLIVNLYDELIGGLKLQSLAILLVGVALLITGFALRRRASTVTAS